MLQIDAAFPAPLQCLFQPKRYKVLYGGRGAGRSWGVARALLIIGTERKIRVLCARELQKSIDESVHQVLSDQVAGLGLQEFYTIQRDRIIGRNGTEFFFEGIKNNINKIRSFEGVDYCWVEEAALVSRNSWQILIPTIRKQSCPNGHSLPANLDEDSGVAICPYCKAEVRQSEIWMTFNPELEDDYTYTRFVRNANPERAFVVKMTWRDNPWFPQVLREEMEEARRLAELPGHEQDLADFLNVWDGECRQIITGAVYAREILRAREERRICPVPWNREWPLDTFWDLGRADKTAIWFGQRVAMQYRVVDYYENSGFDITHYIQHCQSLGYVYGTFWLPHDAKAKRLGSKRTIEEVVRQAGYVVRIVPRLSLADGINAARMVFPQCWFDEDRCDAGINALRHYRYAVVNGQLSKEPVHDDASDGADAFRYMAIALKSPRRDTETVEDRLAAASTAWQKTRGTAAEGRRTLGSRLGWLSR